MALFGIKNKKETTDSPKEEKKVVSVKKTEKTKPVQEKQLQKKSQAPQTHVDYSHVLRRPRITEKATAQAEKNVYVFEIDPRSDKKSVKEAVERVYNVTPVKVNIAKTPSRRFFSRMRRQRGMKSGLSKAYVYLKEGDRIEIV
jgi:large subunit ribosomal protein L23|tara:strand:+ start:24833 stop:25261 length:429 start_codon:yes stop_codon:yes gene_type:complete